MDAAFPIESLEQRRKVLLDHARRVDDQYAIAHLGVEVHGIYTAHPTIAWIIVQASDPDDSCFEYDYRLSTARDTHGAVIAPPADTRDDFEALLDEFCYALREVRDHTTRWPAHHLIADASLGFAADDETAADNDKIRGGQTPHWVVIDVEQVLDLSRCLLDDEPIGQPPRTC